MKEFGLHVPCELPPPPVYATFACSFRPLRSCVLLLVVPSYFYLAAMALELVENFEKARFSPAALAQ